MTVYNDFHFIMYSLAMCPHVKQYNPLITISYARSPSLILDPQTTAQQGRCGLGTRLLLSRDYYVR